MLLKYINQNRIASTAGSASLRGGQLPELAAPQHHTPPVQMLSFASRNEVGQLWGGDRRRRKPILGVMSSRMGPRCCKGSRFLGAANNANGFSASAVWPSRTRALAQLLYFWGNKGYIPVFFISGSNCFFPFEKSRVSRVHSSEPFSQISDF